MTDIRALAKDVRDKCEALNTAILVASEAGIHIELEILTERMCLVGNITDELLQCVTVKQWLPL